MSDLIVLIAAIRETTGTRKAIFQNLVDGFKLQRPITKSHSPRNNGISIIVKSQLLDVFIQSTSKLNWTNAAAMYIITLEKFTSLTSDSPLFPSYSCSNINVQKTITTSGLNHFVFTRSKERECHLPSFFSHTLKGSSHGTTTIATLGFQWTHPIDIFMGNFTTT